jgi:hypothetical protein
VGQSHVIKFVDGSAVKTLVSNTRDADLLFTPPFGVEFPPVARPLTENPTVPTVTLAAPLARWLDAGPGSKSFAVAGATVREAVENLLALAPSLRGYVLDDQGALRHHVAAFVDGVVVRDKQALSDPVRPAGEVYLIQALSGG